MKHAIVIGGGIIGLSSAYYLRKGGWEVTVIDRHAGREGASYGNAGYIGSSHYIPLANPRAFKNALKWMLNPKSPFYVRPSLSPSLIGWGLKFMASATAQHVEASAGPLAEIGLLSQRLYEEWHAEFPTFSYEKKGLIQVYQNEAAFRAASKRVEESAKFGLRMECLSPEELKAVEPDVTFKACGAINILTDAHTYPPRLMEALLNRLREMGVKMIESEAVSFTRQQNRIVEVQTREAPYEADLYVLAAGAWSRSLGDSVGLDIPMVFGRGYSITYPHEVCPLRHPIYLEEVAVAITPMDGDKVRIGGTMEIVPATTPPRIARVQGILESAARLLPDHPFPKVEMDKVWYGYRPCSADGVPYIGRPSGTRNLIVATGHSMLGLGLGPATGKLVCELAEGTTPRINLEPFRLERF